MPFFMPSRAAFTRGIVFAVAGTSSVAVAYMAQQRQENGGMFAGKLAMTTAAAAANKEKAEAEAKRLAFRKKWEQTVKQMQTDVCNAVELIDGKGKFRLDEWTRPEGGGGWTKVLTEGQVFEKAGVNVSTVFGELPPAAAVQMKSRGLNLPNVTPTQKAPFFACGVSLVIHPSNPMAPTTHANYRYFEVMDPVTGETVWWFGGGSDLTPSYLFEEDAVEFHKAQKEACDKHDPTFYKRFKKWCDEYFYLPHRGETRGIGGIFYDDLDEIATAPKNKATDDERKEAIRQFAIASCAGLVKSYVPIMQRRKNMPFTEEQKRWQQLRRGRYVEFNIAIDRGTKFGLQTPGSRIESILMSLPLTARWEYMHVPIPGSEEEKLVKATTHAREWIQ